MPLLVTHVKYKGAVPGSPNLGKRQLNNLIKDAWEATGRYYTEHMTAKHFTKEGGREYGYKPRAGESGNTRKNFWASYTGRKQKKMHHTLPLVFSGEARARSVNVSIRATSKGVRITYPQLQKLNWHNPNSQIDMVDEMHAVSPREVVEIGKVFDAEVQKRLDAIQQTTTK